ncbi:MAG: hypothetical protein ACFFB3_11240 [Candidatus Hodarchaeota archaeon]
MPDESRREIFESKPSLKSMNQNKAEKDHLAQMRSNFHKLSQLFGHLLRAWLDVIFWDHARGLIRTKRVCSRVPNAQDLRLEIHNIYSNGAVLVSLAQGGSEWTMYLHVSPFARTTEVLHSESSQKRRQVYESVNLETGLGTNPNLKLQTELNKQLEQLLTESFNQGHRFVRPHSEIDHNISREEWSILIHSLLNKCR